MLEVPQIQEQDEVPDLMKIIPASAFLAELKGSGQTERRMEAILGMSAQFGVEAAREIMETMEQRRWELVECFGDEPLSPAARQFINFAVDAWIATRFDWVAITTAYAESIGKTAHEVLGDAVAKQQAIREEAGENATPGVALGGNAQQIPPADSAESPQEDRRTEIPSYLEPMRIAPPLTQLDTETEVRVVDAASDTEFNFERYTDLPGAGGN